MNIASDSVFDCVSTITADSEGVGGSANLREEIAVGFLIKTVQNGMKH